MAAFHAHVGYRPHFAHADAAAKLHNATARAFATVRTWYLRASTRRELGILNDYLLADIGMSRREVTKPFWQT